jgi:hypothetical protein
MQTPFLYIPYQTCGGRIILEKAQDGKRPCRNGNRGAQRWTMIGTSQRLALDGQIQYLSAMPGEQAGADCKLRMVVHRLEVSWHVAGIGNLPHSLYGPVYFIVSIKGAHLCSIRCTMASATPGGLGHEMATLSK